MVNQKMISFKIDAELLSQLDEFCSLYGLKRNSVLNLIVAKGVFALLKSLSVSK